MATAEYSEHRCPGCGASFRAIAEHGVCPECRCWVRSDDSRDLTARLSLADLLGLLVVLQISCGAFYIFGWWGAIIAVPAMAVWATIFFRASRPFSPQQLIFAAFSLLLVGILLVTYPLPFLAQAFVACVALAFLAELVVDRFEPLRWRYRTFLRRFWLLFQLLLFAAMAAYWCVWFFQ